MGQGYVLGQSGGGSSKIKGIVDEARAKGVVTAGDFVKLANNSISKNTSTLLSDSTYSGYLVSAIELSSNKVCLLHTYKESKYYLYAVIVIINEDNTFSVGTDTLLQGNSSATERAFSGVALNENKVFVASQGHDTNLLNIIIFTVEGTTITVDFDSGNKTGYYGKFVSVVKLTDNQVFIVGVNPSNMYIYGYCCTISDNNTITLGTSTRIGTYATSLENLKIIKLTSNRILVIYYYSNGNNFLGHICTISGTDITVGNSVNIGRNLVNSIVSYYDLVKMNENKILLIHSLQYTSNNVHHGIYTTLLTIDGTNILVGNTIQLIDVSGIKSIDGVLITNNKIIILYSYVDSSKYTLYISLCRFNDIGMKMETISSLVTNANEMKGLSIKALNEKNIFITYSSDSNYQLRGKMCIIEEAEVTKIDSIFDTIAGIAQSSGTDGQLVKFIKPNYESEESVMKTVYIKSGGVN